MTDHFLKTNTCPPLGPNDVHIWVIDLTLADAGQVARYRQLLSDGEHARVQNFRFATDARAYIITHGVLRILTSVYLAITPSDISFVSNACGKPHLAHHLYQKLPLAFNLSHSADYALIGFTLRYAIGVDVERKSAPLTELDDLAQTVFAPDERRQYFALPATKRVDAFYAGWSRKEAYIKATGAGLSAGLARFSVTLDADDVRVTRTEGDTPDVWSLFALAIDPAYSAAVAIKRRDYTRHLLAYDFGSIL